MANDLDFHEENAIAIIGMVGRFPQAVNIDQFWENLKQGRDCITWFTEEELIQSGISESLISNPKYIRARGILAEVDLFDADFFGITPSEARLMDPQQRLFLEMCWEALELSGYSTLKDRSVGVYAGMSDSTYIVDKEFTKLNSSYQLSIATSNHFLATKISYYLNLNGPSLVINTACSTSLVAIIEACKSLLNYDCDLALAGGISIRLPQIRGYLYQEGGIYSVDGKCRAFDRESSGIVSSNGGGVVILKRLNEAIQAGDSIDAVIRSFAINNDGATKIGYTAPSILEQARCIAMAIASIDAESISYIETHGTGTQLGDPVEIAALTKAFRHYTTKNQYCAIGSVKTNIGHTDVAAGVAGLIKTVLALKHKTIPASLYFNEANSEINFTDSPFYVNSQVNAWDVTYPRRAGVSSFGIGGTNAHLILEEAPLPLFQKTTRDQFIVPLSAKTKTALEQQQVNLLSFLKKKTVDKNELANIAYTLQAGRQTFNYRKVFICKEVNELIELLQRNKSHKIEGEFESIIEKWLVDGEVDWSLVNNDMSLRWVLLPTYPFERKSFWISSNSTQHREQPAIPLIYQPYWQLTELSDSPSDDNTNWLLFVDEFGIAEKIISILKKDVIEVRIGEDFTRISPLSYKINPSIKGHYQELFNSLKIEKKLPHRVLFCWGLRNEKNIELNSTDTKKQMDDFLALIYFLQMIKGDFEGSQFSLYVITNYLANLLSDDKVYPTQSLLLGIVSVVPQELAIRSAVIDIGYIKKVDHELITRLLDESTVNPEEFLVAYRHGLRFSQQYKQYELPERTNKIHLKKNGVYLLTGGLGKIGVKLAEYLASNYEAHLILTTRSATPYMEILQQPSNSGRSPLIQQLVNIKKLASSLTIIQADVADYAQMSTVFQSISTNYGKLNGVFHLAAEVDYSTKILIKDLTPVQLEKQWRAKIIGVNVLACLIESDVDFCLLFSSIATVLGGIGLSAYAAANNYLNYFAESKTLNGTTKWFSMSWDAWNHSLSDNNLKAHTSNRSGRNALTYQQGIDVIEHYFNSMDIPNLFIAQQKKLNKTTNELLRTTQVQEVISKLPFQYSVREILEQIYKEILGMQEIDSNIDFYNLGGDSLGAITLIELIEERLSTSISLADFLNNQSINKLIAFINQKNAANSSVIINLKPKVKSQKSLFLIHPISGTTFCYFDLANYLLDCSCYVLQDPGLNVNADQLNFLSLEEMAFYYLKEIQNKQAHGPYVLGGYSFGATLAFEIAKQLLANNEQVEKMFIIDGWAAFSPQLHDKCRFNREMCRIITELESQMPNLLKKRDTLLAFWWKRMQLLLSYKPTPEPLNIILFKAQETLPEYQEVETFDNHWTTLTTQPIEIYKITGNHSNILELPGAKEIADIINSLLT